MKKPVLTGWHGFCHAFPKFIWLNPEPEGAWQYRQSISVIKQLMNNRMFPAHN